MFWSGRNEVMQAKEMADHKTISETAGNRYLFFSDVTATSMQLCVRYDFDPGSRYCPNSIGQMKDSKGGIVNET